MMPSSLVPQSGHRMPQQLCERSNDAPRLRPLGHLADFTVLTNVAPASPWNFAIRLELTPFRARKFRAEPPKFHDRSFCMLL